MSQRLMSSFIVSVLVAVLSQRRVEATACTLSDANSLSAGPDEVSLIQRITDLIKRSRPTLEDYGSPRSTAGSDDGSDYMNPGEGSDDGGLSDDDDDESPRSTANGGNLPRSGLRDAERDSRLRAWLHSDASEQADDPAQHIDFAPPMQMPMAPPQVVESQNHDEMHDEEAVFDVLDGALEFLIHDGWDDTLQKDRWNGRAGLAEQRLHLNSIYKMRRQLQNIGEALDTARASGALMTFSVMQTDDGKKCQRALVVAYEHAITEEKKLHEIMVEQKASQADRQHGEEMLRRLEDTLEDLSLLDTHRKWIGASDIARRKLSLKK